MSDSQKEFFNKGASAYDEQRAKFKPINDALYLCMNAVFSELPGSARILCVGAGTGAELIYLAQNFPNWQFTVVEPSKQMISQCIQQAENLGIAERCEFHEGYLNSLPETEPFDAATSILVSHFIIDYNKRAEYFNEINNRLKPGALLINADLVSDMTSAEFNNLINVWVALFRQFGKNFDTAVFGRDVSLISTKEMESLLISVGFNEPVLFFQSLLIHAWFSKRK